MKVGMMGKYNESFKNINGPVTLLYGQGHRVTYKNGQNIFRRISLKLVL